MMKYKFEYLLARLVGLIAKSINLNTALKIGDFFGDLFYFIIKIRKEVALKNIKAAFGNEKNEQQLKHILRLTYRHFGRTLMEFARIPVLTEEKFAQQVKIKNRQSLVDLLAKNKGVLVLSGHFGNWEYLAAALATVKPPLYAVFKPLKNKAIDKIIRDYREALKIAPLKIKGAAAKGLIRALRDNSIALNLFDQDAGKNGIFVNFFGTPASTTRGPAMIAIKNRIPAIMAFGIRGKNGRISIHLHNFPDINSFPKSEEGYNLFLIKYNEILEKFIRKYPEQYLWMHKRWRSKPPEDHTTSVH